MSNGVIQLMVLGIPVAGWLLYKYLRNRKSGTRDNVIRVRNADTSNEIPDYLFYHIMKQKEEERLKKEKE